MHLADVDPAVFWGLMVRAWWLIATPLTLFFISSYFTPEMQGYYYTFSSILAFQFLGELGLGHVLVMFASHEWAALQFDKSGFIAGDSKALSRLISLGKIAFKWYIFAGVIIACVLGMVGYIFFSKNPASDIEWFSPWIVLCLFTGINFCLLPVWSILEGCHQVASVNLYRFISGVFINISIWAVIFFGFGLWALAVSTLIRILVSIVFLRYKYSNFLKSFFNASPAESIHWVKEAWPMQWRIALGATTFFLVSCLFTPIMFSFHGPVVAGQTGMTLVLKDALASVATIWTGPKAPQFGSLCARKEYEEMDRLFWRLMKIVAIASSVGALLICLVIFLLNYSGHELSTRFLPLGAISFFLAAQVVCNISQPIATYLRAHKRDPLLLYTVGSGIFIVLSNFIMGKYFAAHGMALGFFVLNLLAFPFLLLIWQRCRKAWH